MESPDVLFMRRALELARAAEPRAKCRWARSSSATGRDRRRLEPSDLGTSTHRARRNDCIARGRCPQRQLSVAGHDALRDVGALRDVRRGDGPRASPAPRLRRDRSAGGGRGQCLQHRAACRAQPPAGRHAQVCWPKSAERCCGISSSRDVRNAVACRQLKPSALSEVGLPVAVGVSKAGSGGGPTRIEVRPGHLRGC